GAVSLAGCGGGPQITPVSGKVVYKNQPLTSGLVMFQPASGQPARGEIQPDGTFVMETFGNGDGATIGVNQVRVVARKAPKNTDPTRGEVGVGELTLPEKLASYGTSGIEITVEAGKTEPYVITLPEEMK